MKYILPFLIWFGIFFSCSEKEIPQVPKLKTDSVIESVTEPSVFSEITCPKCNFRKKEKMPADVCLLKYTCQSCRAELFPKEGDCCVFCSYGDYKCPSKQ